MKTVTFKTHAKRMEFFQSMLNNYINDQYSDFRSQLSKLSTKETINFISNAGESTNYSILDMFLIVQKFIIG